MALTKVRGAGAEGLTLSTTDLKIDSGDLVFSTADKGVVLGATSNTDANTISDYEEGTWTPTVSTDSGGTTVVYSATYTKVGRFVNFGCYITWENNQGDNANEFRINGLPFTCASNYASGGFYITYSENSNMDSFSQGTVNNGTNYLVFRTLTGNLNSLKGNAVHDASFVSGVFHGTYHV